MAFYIAIDVVSIEKFPSGGGSLSLQALEDGNGNTVLPMFTSEEQYWDFAEAYGLENDSVKPIPFNIFKLAKFLSWAGGAEETCLVALDPFVVGAGWQSSGSLSSVREFCLFIEKLQPVTQGWAQKGLAKFGDDPEKAKRILDWVKPQIPEKLGDIQALVREHLVEDGN